jgi:hypothetical protein
VLAHASTVYVLQGQIESVRGDEAKVRFISQRGSVPRMRSADIWIAYRVHTLRWTSKEFAILSSQLKRWNKSGNNVVGVQIDFDARTLHLDEYMSFLQKLRSCLPAEYRLGITGLLDWSTRISPDEVNRLRGIVDEVVVQTYQGRHTIENVGTYLPRISALKVPFKIGLIQGGTWDEPFHIGENPWFRGYVVFLQNPSPGGSPAQNRRDWMALPNPLLAPWANKTCRTPKCAHKLWNN